MVLGANPTGSTVSGDYFHGKIYTVRIYDRALTAEEINHNYQVDKIRYDKKSSGHGSDEPKYYVQNDLLLHYDAINNTGSGHSTSTTTWRI
jgi:hypothetical protein